MRLKTLQHREGVKVLTLKLLHPPVALAGAVRAMPLVPHIRAVLKDVVLPEGAVLSIKWPPGPITRACSSWSSSASDSASSSSR